MTSRWKSTMTEDQVQKELKRKVQDGFWKTRITEFSYKCTTGIDGTAD